MWRPAGFDAGPFLQAVVISCQLWVTLHTQAEKVKEVDICVKLQFNLCDNNHTTPISVIDRLFDAPTQNGRHRQCKERWPHQPERSFFRPGNNWTTEQSRIKGQILVHTFKLYLYTFMMLVDHQTRLSMAVHSQTRTCKKLASRNVPALPSGIPPTAGVRLTGLLCVSSRQSRASLLPALSSCSR